MVKGPCKKKVEDINNVGLGEYKTWDIYKVSFIQFQIFEDLSYSGVISL